MLSRNTFARAQKGKKKKEKMMIIQRRWEIRNFNGFANQRARLMRITVSTDKKRVLAAKLRENRNDSDSSMKQFLVSRGNVQTPRFFLLICLECQKVWEIKYPFERKIGRA